MAVNERIAEHPSMEHGCYDCLNDGAPLLDGIVAALVIVPIVLFVVWAGYHLVLRLKVRRK